MKTEIPRIAIQVSRDIVVASIQIDLEEAVLAQFQEDLLDCIHGSASRGVILDVSGLETLDAEEFVALRRIIEMARLLGAESVLVGLRPGVVSALVETGADIDGLRAAINLDTAFALFEPQPEADGSAEPESDPESPEDPDAAPLYGEPEEAER